MKPRVAHVINCNLPCDRSGFVFLHLRLVALDAECKMPAWAPACLARCPGRRSSRRASLPTAIITNARGWPATHAARRGPSLSPWRTANSVFHKRSSTIFAARRNHGLLASQYASVCLALG